MSHVKPKKKTAKRKYRKPLGYDFTVLFIVLILAFWRCHDFQLQLLLHNDNGTIP